MANWDLIREWDYSDQMRVMKLRDKCGKIASKLSQATAWAESAERHGFNPDYDRIEHLKKQLDSARKRRDKLVNDVHQKTLDRIDRGEKREPDPEWK